MAIFESRRNGFSDLGVEGSDVFFLGVGGEREKDASECGGGGG